MRVSISTRVSGYQMKWHATASYHWIPLFAWTPRVGALKAWMLDFMPWNMSSLERAWTTQPQVFCERQNMIYRVKRGKRRFLQSMGRRGYNVL